MSIQTSSSATPIVKTETALERITREIDAEDARQIKIDMGECPDAGDHEVIYGICINCGAEFIEPDDEDDDDYR